MPSSPLRLLILALAGLSSASASAQLATVSAELSGLRYELVDLAPDDGIAPEIVFDSATLLGTDSVYDRDGLVREHYRHVAGDASLSLPYGTLLARLGDGAVSTRTTVTNRHADLPNLASRASYVAEFTLSPHTGLFISALGSTRVAGATAIAEEAIVELRGSMRTGPGGSFYFSDRHVAGQDGDEDSGPLKLSGFLYSGAATQSGSIGLYASSRATVLAVPEPSTYALFLTGALVLGASLRRRSASIRCARFPQEPSC